MKHLSIQSTVDMYPDLTPQQREQLFKEERVIQQMKESICTAFGWSYCGFTNEQIKEYHTQIFK